MCCPIVQQGTAMHNDIEITRMDNAYETLLVKIQPLLKDHLKKHGQAYATYAMQQLAIEFSGRHLIAVKAIIPEDKKDLVVAEFFQMMLGRANDLLEQAIEAGIAKRR
jgi:hypothetical protein